MISHMVPIDYGPYTWKGGTGGLQKSGNVLKYVKPDNFMVGMKMKILYDV